ncbi:AfsR/SARP family transcriptional regulator [Streptomyces sp. BA2]|uniref:AfsR/SARP family transcriptional regulator n=1 Tax=Streptomyces sp. BA2 TaxID=436595 RepID=UPI00132B8AF7|nr:BTAD domain-containing putative transcriptional regulator [Streptomyces sp. BA2]MWA10765.1 AfsR family transcriptional regulator [Streptomyces sp. BA2]
MDPVRYRILGTTQAVHADGTLIAVGGPRLRALLTILALRVPRTVPAQALVDEVWHGDPPADATGALQALVGRLRRAIGAGAITSTDGGYQLCAAPDDIDLYRFDRLATEGTNALADSDAAKAAAILDDALALWQGPALADLPDRTAEAARWESRRLEARRARLAAALALGRAEQVLPELAALCESHPLDEPLQALRLRALRDAGRPAQALAAYDGVRRLIADRIGADPGPELRALHEELLHADAPKAPPARTRTAQRPQGNLRARLTSFVGREDDIDAIRGDLARARLVTLLGPGGAGKTRLSQEAAEAHAGGVPDGVWLAELAPVEDPDAVPEAVLTALGARETVLRGAGAEELRAVSEWHGDDPVVRLTEHCAPRRMLLILDNCEHVIDAAARLADRLLAHCPGLTVLATSREPLGVPGELLHPVEPLPEPIALRLLADRGAAARPDFRIEDDRAAAAEICRRLDGLPLAIELAAARLRMLTPRQIADRLDDRFRLLTNGARTVLPRQQTLRAVVDWSWDLLDTPERTVLRRLSVFAGGCDLAAAEAVCGAPAESPDVADVLGSLVDKSLVVAAPSPQGVMRYRQLETVGEYARERLDEAGDRAAAERAHLVYFRELARLTEPRLRGGGQREAVERLEVEYENLRTALRHAVAAGEEQEALCLVLSLSWFWTIRDLRIEIRNWSRDVVALGPDPFVRPVTPVEPLYERCTDNPPPMRPEVLEEARRGVHLIQLSCMDMNLEVWQTPEAAEKLAGIREAYRPGLPQTCWSPGSLWFFAVLLDGDIDQLHVIIDATIATCRERGYDWELAASLQQRANILANRADRAGDARRDADESLEIFTRLGDVWGMAEALSSRGEAHERRGRFTLAAEDFGAAIEHAERLGAPAQVSVLTARLGAVLAEAGELARGEELLWSVMERDGKAAANSSESLPAARFFLVDLLTRTGRTVEAREQLRLLREEFKAVDFVIFEGFMLGAEAWISAVEGRHAEALATSRAALDKSLDPLSKMMAPQMTSVHLTTAARALAALDGGRYAHDAARLIAVADRELPPGHFAPAAEREIRTAAEESARGALGDTAYEAAYAEGGSLSVEEAAALCDTYIG